MEKITKYYLKSIIWVLILSNNTFQIILGDFFHELITINLDLCWYQRDYLWASPCLPQLHLSLFRSVNLSKVQTFAQNLCQVLRQDWPTPVRVSLRSAPIK